MKEMLNRSLVLICALALVSSLVATHSAIAQPYVAYAVTKDGEFPIPEDFDDIDDKYLI